MKRLAATLATIWQLSVPYFRSEDRWPGRILLASVIAIELASVAITVLLNQWYNRFYNTLQDRDWNAFVSAEPQGLCGVFTISSLVFGVMSAFSSSGSTRNSFSSRKG